MAEVGTKLRVSSSDSFSQYNVVLRPISAKASLAFASCASKWFFAVWTYLSRVSRELVSLLGTQVLSLSILFKAIQKGVFFCLKSWIDSRVCCSRPCMISTTNTAMSQRLEPRALKFVKDSCPGVSITKNPGISRSRGSRWWTVDKCLYKFSPGK